MRKIKVIVKRPDEKIGHVTYISNTLENLQKIVGGKIEVVHTGISGLILILDEEGKLKKCLLWRTNVAIMWTLFG